MDALVTLADGKVGRNGKNEENDISIPSGRKKQSEGKKNMHVKRGPSAEQQKSREWEANGERSKEGIQKSHVSLRRKVGVGGGNQGK